MGVTVAWVSAINRKEGFSGRTEWEAWRWRRRRRKWWPWLRSVCEPSRAGAGPNPLPDWLRACGFRSYISAVKTQGLWQPLSLLTVTQGIIVGYCFDLLCIWQCGVLHMQNVDQLVLDWNTSASASQHFHEDTLGVKSQTCFHYKFFKCLL